MAVSRVTPFNPAVDDVESWTSVLRNLLVASGIDRKKDDQKVKASATLLAPVGVPTYTLLKDLVSPRLPETMEFDDLVKVLKDHYKPAPKAISERYNFYNRRQLPTETVSTFISELRRMATTCKFKNLDISLRDQFVVGLSSEAAQKQLFLEDDSLKLEKALQIAISQETADASTKLIREAQPPLNSITAYKVQPKKGKGKSSGCSSQLESSGSGQKYKGCGSPRHKVSDCPYKDIECFKCGGLGHFAKRCLSAGDDAGGKRHTLNHILDDDSDPPVEIELKMNGKNVEMELDTGAGKTFIPPSVWKQIGSPELLPTRLQFVSYTGTSVKLKGKAEVDIVYNGQCVKHSVFVTSYERGCLFGRDLLRKLQTGLDLEDFRELFDSPVAVVNSEDAEVILKRIREENPVTSKKLKYETSRDLALTQVIQLTQSGWPEKLSSVPDLAKPYFVNRHELTVKNGTVMWLTRVVVPESLQPVMLEQLHDTHPGIVRMKLLARQYIWWPGIDVDIENTVKTCPLCCNTRDDPAAAPLQPRRNGEAERTLLDPIRPGVSQTGRRDQEKQVEDFWKNETRQLKIGQPVWVKTFTKGSPTWSLGKTLDARGPLTYVVEAGRGRFRRHVDHLLDGEPVKSPTPTVEDRQEDDEIVLFPPEPPAEEHPSVFVVPN